MPTLQTEGGQTHPTREGNGAAAIVEQKVKDQHDQYDQPPIQHSGVHYQSQEQRSIDGGGEGGLQVEDRIETRIRAPNSVQREACSSVENNQIEDTCCGVKG